MTGAIAGSLSFDLDGQRLDCRVLRARRHTYALRVTADGVLELRVPQRLPARLLPDILQRHRRWIAGQFARRAARVAAAPDFAHGSPQRYLGEAYPLRLVAGRAQAQLQDAQLHVSVPAPEHAPTVTRALDRWYRRQALALLPARLTELSTTLPWLAGRVLLPPRVVRLRARWGSCAADGQITLNLGLVLLAQPLIDYVLFHELCHLREMNHGARFYALLAAAVPDHRERQAALRQERPWRPMQA